MLPSRPSWRGQRAWNWKLRRQQQQQQERHVDGMYPSFEEKVPHDCIGAWLSCVS